MGSGTHWIYHSGFFKSFLFQIMCSTYVVVFFYWGIVDLQCCVSFSCMDSSSDSFPLQVLQDNASLVAQMVKNSLAMQKTWIQSLGWESLEEGMATCSSILAWRIPMDRGAWRATVHCVAQSQTWLSDTHSEHSTRYWKSSPYHPVGSCCIVVLSVNPKLLGISPLVTINLFPLSGSLFLFCK